mmetsp:Transcript_136883/g.237853  ORF Transcript_136883/g.237853 Transcript_136883/m.237853 type:complete len:336 (-) Transcript_136883:962-1969(-)
MIPCTLLDRGYIKKEYVGRGSFGITFTAHHTRDPDSLCVVKQVSLNSLSDKHRTRTFREVELLKDCDHPNIVKYIDSLIDEEGSLNIVMEQCSQGDLTACLGKVNEGTMWSYVIQTLQGLKYLHDKRVLHRDLKPSNILLAGDNTIKIADMGLGRVLSAETQFAQTFCGSPLYLPPEQHTDDCRYDCSSDIWALGCTFYELAAGSHPFESQSMTDMLRRIKSMEPKELPPVWPLELQFLVKEMLQKDPSQRPTADQIFSFFPIRAMVQRVLFAREQRSYHQQYHTMKQMYSQQHSKIEALAHENEKLRQRIQKYKEKAQMKLEEKRSKAKSEVEC